jgi:hypothetical protein
MCCTNCGSFDCGQGRSGPPSQSHRRNMQQSNPVRLHIRVLPPFPARSNLSDVYCHCHWRRRPKAIDASLTPSGLIADAVKRSSRAHVFHFYTLLCEIASVPRKPPSAWIAGDRLVAASKEKQENGGRMSTQASSGAGPGMDHGHVLSFDARVLARECLKEVGRELGVPR